LRRNVSPVLPHNYLEFPEGDLCPKAETKCFHSSAKVQCGSLWLVSRYGDMPQTTVFLVDVKALTASLRS